MPSQVLALLPLDFALGFKLTGIDTQACASTQEAGGYLERELTDPRYNLLLIDENFLLSFNPGLRKRAEGSTMPLVMPVPLKKSFKEEIEAKDYFLKMVHSAIGYEIRIR